MFTTTTFFNKGNIFNQSLKDYALRSTYDSIQKYMNKHEFNKNPYNISSIQYIQNSENIEENNNNTPTSNLWRLFFFSSFIGFIILYKNKK